MENSREPKAHKMSRYRILGDLDGEEEPKSDFGDVPLKLTEEKIRVERERHALVPEWDRVPLEVERSASAHARHFEAWRAAKDSSTTSAPSATTPAPSAHLSFSRDDPAMSEFRVRRDQGSPARVTRAPRALWTVIIALTLAIGGAGTYSYVALRRSAVIVSRLPGAATLRALRGEAADARSDLQRFEQSRFSMDAKALANEARPVLAGAWHRAERLPGEMYDRYETWRSQR
jgi:hypothetical protein